jgi:hypothetical protein
MADAYCPVCKKKYPAPIQVARHIFGTNDPPPHKWVDDQGKTHGGFTFDDLLIDQITKPGNVAYETIAEMVEKAQGSIQI